MAVRRRTARRSLCAGVRHAFLRIFEKYRKNLRKMRLKFLQDSEKMPTFAVGF